MIVNEVHRILINGVPCQVVASTESIVYPNGTCYTIIMDGQECHVEAVRHDDIKIEECIKQEPVWLKQGRKKKGKRSKY